MFTVYQVICIGIAAFSVCFVFAIIEGLREEEKLKKELDF